MAETIKTSMGSGDMDKTAKVGRMVSSFVKDNEVLCCILMEMCERCDVDYSSVIIKGVERYLSWKEGCASVERGKDVAEREEVVVEHTDEGVVVMTDDEKIDLWERDFNGFVERGETDKARCLYSLIVKNEGDGLVRRFKRIMGGRLSQLGLVG